MPLTRTCRFEYEVVSAGTSKEMVQRPDHPDVLFQQVGQVAGDVGCQVQRLQAFGGREIKELSHGLPGR